MRILFTLLVLLNSTIALSSSFETIEQRTKHYKNEFQLFDILTKKVNNHGRGDESLYGVRNFRVVLHGVLYRGGGNNLYLRSGARDNKNPLPEVGLNNLCEKGFQAANYLYPTRFSTAPENVECSDNKLSYFNKLHSREIELSELLKKVYEIINNPLAGPLYSHCWNGWHASGLFAAMALIQYCSFTAQKAVEYWDLGTDGVNRNPRYEKIRQKIRNFRPIKELEINSKTKALICPEFLNSI